MKTKFQLLGILLLTLSCTPTVPLPVGAARIAGGVVVLDVSRDDGFFPSEQIWFNSNPTAKNPTSRVGLASGSGLPYYYYPDRGVYIPDDDAFNSVTIACETNMMSDAKTCELAVGYGNLNVSVSPSGNILRACAFMHDFPGRHGAVRVDSHPMISTDESGCVSGSGARVLVQQLKVGKTLSVQTVQWPYDVGRV
ncbi:hypothetical protein [Cypionkella sp.]|uniref:hypothetical protein n=1 Tax=Cypionkella sp. TaxID=2811411 RepID=UPI00260D502B|nr:hypothetical protein [Cypionkella sp.]